MRDTRYLKLQFLTDVDEVYAPAADAYIKLREDGTILIKKASGQESFQCKQWHTEADNIKVCKLQQTRV